VQGVIPTVLIDRKADAQALFVQMQRQRRILRLTTTR
jgi:hypothetical protein